MTDITKGFDYTGYQKPFVEASRKRALRIMELDRELAHNVVEQGKVLCEQRDAFGPVGVRRHARGADAWGVWCQAECGITARYAARLIQISEKFDVVDSTTTALIGHEVMKMLASNSTPAELIQQAITAAKDGAPLSIKAVREMKKIAKADMRPAPTEAKEIAKTTGEVVVGSDNRIYTPIEEEEHHDYEDRRDRTYNTIDAIDGIAGLPVDPKTWLETAEAHWLSNLRLSNIEAARDWLAVLYKEYKAKNKVIENGHEEG